MTTPAGAEGLKLLHRTHKNNKTSQAHLPCGIAPGLPTARTLLAAAGLLACAGVGAQTAAPAAAASAPAPAASAAPMTSPVNGYAEMLKAVKPRTPSAMAAAKRPYAPIRRVDDEGQIPEIEMFVGESRVFPTPGVARIAVGNGTMLTAAALDNKEVIVFANQAGTSSLFIWNADGRYQRVKVNIVPGDTSRHAREIAAFLSTIPKARASIVGPNIIVEGDDLSDADLSKIDDLGKRYPQIVNFTNRVGWEQMILLDVKVVEFPITYLRDIGLKWTPTGGAAIGGIWSPGRRGSDGPYQISIATGTTNAPPISAANGGAVLIPNGLNVLSYLNLGINAQLNLLAQEGKAALLAEPQLSARNGAKASFIAGGEIPYSVQTRDGLAVMFKPYGVKLDITPKVDHRGVIRATMLAEVSSIDSSLTTTSGPALLTRRTETEFNLRDGETMVLAGLLQRSVSTDIDKVPLLGDLPVLGALFRSKRYQNKETELVVFVTPTVVNANSVGTIDRVQRTTERLQERMGDPAPYLSDPLQPGVAQEKPNVVPPREAPPRPASSPAAATPTPLKPALAAPIASAERTVPKALTLDAPTPNARRYRVAANGLALRATPDVNAGSLARPIVGDIVRALPHPPRGGWTAVQIGDADTATRGWLPTQWLVPAAP